MFLHEQVVAAMVSGQWYDVRELVGVMGLSDEKVRRGLDGAFAKRLVERTERAVSGYHVRRWMRT